MKNRIPRLLVALGAAACLAAPAAGQGSSVYVHSSCLSGRGQAGVAAPCDDGSAVYFNPAGIVSMPSTIGVGVTGIWNAGTYTYDSTGVAVERDPSVPLVPHLYATYRASERLGFGFGFFAPYGLGIEWPQEFEGRFISWKSALQGLYFQPTVAYQIAPGYAVGAGLDVVKGGIEINRHLDGPITEPSLAQVGVPPGTDIASATLEGSGWGATFNVSVLAEVHERLTVGARYMHSARIDLEGTADFEQIQTGRTLYLPIGPGGSFVAVALDDLVAPQFLPDSALADQSATSAVTLPPQAVVGMRLRATDDMHLLFDYQWTGWSTFDELTANFEFAPELTLTLNYMDTHTYRAGAEYDVGENWIVRGGWIYNTNATPDETVTPILPEAERNYVTAGLGGWVTDRLRADIYYNYVRQADRRGRVRGEWTVPVTPEQLNIGVYENRAHIIGATFAYRFGQR